MSWDDEKVAKLKELWGKGNTASQIAEILGGLSRNAVIGKAHRLNLSAKIKTRTSPSNNFKSENDEYKIKSRQSKRNKFRSLIIERILSQKIQNNLRNWMIILANGQSDTLMKSLLFLWKNFVKRFFLLQTTFVVCLSTKR